MAILAMAVGTPAQAQDADLVLTGVGRFALFADRDSRMQDGRTARIRAFQVVEADFIAGWISPPSATMAPRDQPRPTTPPPIRWSQAAMRPS